LCSNNYDFLQSFTTFNVAFEATKKKFFILFVFKEKFEQDDMTMNFAYMSLGVIYL
jgi:hypothetical protein